MLRTRRLAGTVSLNVAMTLLALFALIPFGVALSWSFKPLAEIFQLPVSPIPQTFSLDNYTAIFTDEHFEVFFRNSILAAVGYTSLGILWCSLGGWSLSQYRTRLNGPLLVMLFLVIALPFQVMIVPAFELVVQFGLVNTLWALIVPFSASAYGILFMRQYMLSLPREVFESARIDGASEFRIWRSLALPMSVPGIAALGIFLFLDSWNDFLWPLVVLTGRDNLTYPLGLNLLVGLFHLEYGQMMAASILALVPVAVILLFMQRQFISGITAGALRR
ncbi:MAG TPA: carbohydrate ABC transporter permease [Patescibacteria group bacterium]|jgi:ABC-type glycerol-3-phosphate transport system permease component|nr:carbohydrate ABC transporter permease [Patescibacteria group bacterium]